MALLQTSHGFRRFHWITSCVLVVVTIAACCGLPFLKFDDDPENLFRGESEEYAKFKAVAEDFGTQDNECLILLSADDVLSVNSLKLIRRLDTALLNCPKIDPRSVRSLCLLQEPRRVFRIFFEAVPSKLSDPTEDWIDAAQQLRDHPLGLGHLYSEDYSHAIVAFRFAESVTREKIAAAVAEITATVEENWCDSSSDFSDSNSSEKSDSQGPSKVPSDGLSKRSFGLTGLPILRFEVTAILQRDQIKFTVLGLILATIVGALLFRKIAPMLVVAVIPMVGLGWTMGGLAWLGVSLNIVNNVITPLVLVIGFAEAVHILFVFGQKLGEGKPQQAAVRETLQQLILPCSLAALTTAIGFGSLWFADDRALQEFAMVAVGGSSLMFIVVLFGSGCLIASPIGRFCDRKMTPETLHLNKISDDRLHETSERTVAELKSKASNDTKLSKWRHLTLVCIAVASLLGFSFAAFRNAPDYRFTEYLPQHHDAVKTLKKIDEQFGGSSPLHIVIQLPGKTKLQTLSEILELTHKQLELIEFVSRPISLLNVLQSMPDAEQGPKSQFGEFQFLPSDVKSEFILARPVRINLRVQLRDIGSAQAAPVVDQIRSKMSLIQAGHPDMKWHLAGLNILAATRSEKMIRDLVVSLFAASLIIFALIQIVYRSLVFAIAAIVVNTFPILGVAAAMAWMGTPIQYTSIMLLCTCLGLAVDDTVHFLSKTSQLLNDGVEYSDAVLITQKRLWPILGTTTAMLGVGFGLAATSEIPTFQSFGAYACVALLLALIGDLIFLPSLLIVCQRSFSRSR